MTTLIAWIFKLYGQKVFDITFGDVINTVTMGLLIISFLKQNEIIGSKIGVFDGKVYGILDELNKKDLDVYHFIGSLNIPKLLFYNEGDRMSIISILHLQILEPEIVPISNFTMNNREYDDSDCFILEPQKELNFNIKAMVKYYKPKINHLKAVTKLEIVFSYTHKGSVKIDRKTINVILRNSYF